MFQKFLLQHMQAIGPSQSFDRLDRLALRLHAQHQAGAQRAAVNNDSAGSAVARQASFFAASQFEHITQGLKQALARLTQEFSLLSIDSCFDYYFLCHFFRRLTHYLRLSQKVVFPVHLTAGWASACPLNRFGQGAPG